MGTIIALHWRGPLISLTGERIDRYAPPVPIPSRSTVVGLLAAALGFRRGDPRIDELWRTTRHAVVVHRAGVPIVDFQTADLTQPYLPESMWWVDEEGRVGVMAREGSGPALGRRTQERALVADADMTVFVELLGGCPWTAQELLEAVDHPRFPLYLGRAACPPTGRVAGGVVDADTLPDAVRLTRPGTTYLPVEVVEEAWSDVLVAVPERARGEGIYVVRQ
jgi:CRISPR system Cascade subunit CasD